MNALQQVLDSNVIQQCGWVLVHSVWQLSLVAIVYLVIRQLLRSASSAARYVTNCIAMVAMAALPVLTMWATSGEAVDTAPARSGGMVAVAPVESLPEPPSPPEPPETLPESAGIHAPQAAEPTTMGAAPARAAEPWGDWLAARIDPVLPWIVGIWMLGVAVLAVWQFGGWMVVRRLCHIETQPVDGPILERFEQLAQRLNVVRPVRLLRSLRVDVPSVVGHFKPIVMLPASMISGLTTHEIEAILAHELAHIRRHDYLVNLLQSLIEILLFYHPAVWWLSREIRNERENCCDDLAAAICGDRVTYARALAALAEAREAVPVARVAANGGSLLTRIRRLVDQPTVLHPRRDACFAATLVLVLLTSLVLAATGAFSSAGVAEGLAGRTNALPLVARSAGTFRDPLLETERALAYLGEPAFRHRMGASQLAFLPDGQRLVTLARFSEEQAVYLWDVATGRRLLEFAVPKRDVPRPSCLAVSPRDDLVAVGRSKGAVSVWDASTGRLRFHDQMGESGVTSIAFSADGERLITGDSHGMVRLIGVHDFSLQHSYVVPCQRDRRSDKRKAYIGATALSPDGKRLAVGECIAGSIYLFDVDSGEIVVGIESAIGSRAYVSYPRITNLVFTDNGRHLVSTGHRLTPRHKTTIEAVAKNVQLLQVRLWDTATGQLKKNLIGEDVWSIGTSAFAPGGGGFVTVDNDAMRLWRMGEPRPRRRVSMRGYRSAQDVAYSPDGSTIALPTRNGITFWDAETGQRRWHDHPPRYTDLRSVAWSPRGDQLAIGYADGLELWGAATGQREQVMSMGIPGETYQYTPGASRVVFTADGGLLVAATTVGFATDWPPRGRIRVWNTANGEQLRTIRIDRPVWSMALADDGSVIAVTTGHGNSSDTQLCVFDLATGRLLSRFPDQVENLPETRIAGFERVEAMRVLSESSTVFLACEDGRCFQWDYVRQREMGSFYADERTDRRGCKIRNAVISPDGSSLVISGKGKICLWNMHSQTLERVEMLPSGENWLELGISHDGRRLTGVDVGFPEPRTVHPIWIWDLPGLTLRQTIAPPDARATCFAFSPDNTRLLSGLRRGTAVIWDVRDQEHAARH